MVPSKLTGEYNLAYIDIMSYIQSCNLDFKFSHQVMEDMLDMLLSAQRDNLPVSDVIGNNIKSFCEEIVQSHNTNKNKLLSILKAFNLYLLLQGLLTLLFELFKITVTASSIIAFFLTWYLFRYALNFCYKKIGLRFKGLKNKIKCILLIALVLLLLVVSPLIFLLSTHFTAPVNGYYITIICWFSLLIIHMISMRLDKNMKWYNYF